MTAPGSLSVRRLADRAEALETAGCHPAEPVEAEVLLNEPGVRAIGFMERAGWFAASAGGALFVGDDRGDTTYRFIEVGIDS